MIGKNKTTVDRKMDLSIWLLVFIVTSFIALLIQLLILPVIFPSWHALDGMLANADSPSFHREAVAIAQNIKEIGWSVWELRPKGWMPVGVASAIYALTVSKPWVLIPLNAAVHATTVLIVYKILLFFTKSRKNVFIAALPFAFFPSAALWYSQIHRDGYHILGVMLFAYGLMVVIDHSMRSINYFYNVFSALLVSAAGLALVWLVRPYFLIILFAVGTITFLFTVLHLIVQYFKNDIDWRSVVVPIICFIILLGLMIPLMRIDEAGKYQREIFMDNKVDYSWESLPWLPRKIDNLLYSAAYLRVVRYPQNYGETASAIDYDRKFTSGYGFIYYLPRALQVGYLAPFPSEWFGDGSYSSTSFFRRIAALEMIFVYLALASLLYGFWIWRKQFFSWFLTLYCTASILPIIYAVPNVGTIYRYRYGYLMLMVSLGVVAFLELIKNIKEGRRQVNSNTI